jgi:dTDP-4-dehydrorhamnose reductase
VIGASGRLGGVVAKELLQTGYTVSSLDFPDFDITNASQVSSVFRWLNPDVIVNCSAYNAVDAAESNVSAAFALNAHGPSYLAAAAKRCNAMLVHYSTDFVFDGESDRPYTEDDPVNPLSVYGASKKAGEDESRQAPRHFILRLESLFGGSGLAGHQATVDYFLNAILGGVKLRAACDRTTSPSYVPDVVRATLELIKCDAGYGTYHCVNSGFTTWDELAREIARQLGVSIDVEALTSEGLKTSAKRPKYCALSNAKLAALGIRMPSWQSAIQRHLVRCRLASQSAAVSSRESSAYHAR